MCWLGEIMITTDDFKDVPDPEEKVKPLSAAEKKWVNRLEKVLQSCPTDRIALYTIGDPNLTVIDGEYTIKYNAEISDGYAGDNGVVLAEIRSKPAILGVSG